MRILVAYDGSRHARRALDEACRRSWPRGSRLRVVMVLQEPFALEPPFEAAGEGPLVERVRRARRATARLHLEKIEKTLQSKTSLK
ncbi:MAG TPA: universal stress protein, partial [Patescibacteria group bacterium]|nr:universal stress protein [Patescibacteria group bacterium]